MQIQKLSQFYEVMNNTREVRKQVVALYLENKTVSSSSIQELHDALNSLENIPFKDGKYILPISSDKNIVFELTYEIEELKKDIIFLDKTETDFRTYLKNIHPGLSDQVTNGTKALKDVSFNNFITDRDGTINNYCGRYLSSTQSIYNSVYITRYAQKCVNNSVILTSAPLDNIGLVDLSINPDNIFNYAGSKGREYIDITGLRNHFPIEESKQVILNLLNEKLSELVRKPEFELYSMIGSGLQYKFGQTTIARQDIYMTVPEKESENFLNVIKKTVHEIDPNKEFFRVEDTGLDIEIILTIQSDSYTENLKDFDKGDGVNFLDKELDLRISESNNLICGDTKSDVPMVIASMKKTQNSWSVFVTKDDNLKLEVSQVCPNALFVTEPDALITILDVLSTGN
ncbi:MAG: hypothetical protein P9M03_11690 [Candidatus Theseobacter exili]|nr:hypothetical protein [Candidatus Theseobacter exili]